MPRKSLTPSLADEQAAPGGAAAVDKALSVLSAFQGGDIALSVTELAHRTKLYKSTVLRMLASLAHAGFTRKTEDGLWSLGSELPRLASVYTSSFSLQTVVLPVMQKLMRLTGESVSFHIRQADQRLCLFRVDSPQLLRDHVKAGDLLPLDRGAGGRVLMAFSGARGKIYDQIRRDGFVHSVNDRVTGLVGVSAPIWKGEGQLLGALTLTVPETRFQNRFIEDLRTAVVLLQKQLNF